MQIYAGLIICISDHGIKGMCQSFNLVPLRKILRDDWVTSIK